MSWLKSAKSTSRKSWSDEIHFYTSTGFNKDKMTLMQNCVCVLSLDPSLLFLRYWISFCIDFLCWLLKEIFARLTFCWSSVITRTYYNKLVWKNYWDGKETNRERLNQSQLTSTEENIMAYWKEQTLAMVGLVQKVETQMRENKPN